MSLFQEPADELLGGERVLSGPRLAPGGGGHHGDDGVPGDGDGGVGGSRWRGQLLVVRGH